jgi:TPR repeat protein
MMLTYFPRQISCPVLAGCLSILLVLPGRGAAAETQPEETVRGRFADAVAAYDAQDYTSAYAIWLALAKNGDLAAQRNLGHLYRRGLGVARDFAEARRWYEAAAKKGFAGAQANLAMMYLNGEGVGADNEEAARWFDAAAKQGHVISQYNLGLLYWRGSGVPKDEARALAWLYLAARSGYGEALKAMGQIIPSLAGPADTLALPESSATHPPADDMPEPATTNDGELSGSQKNVRPDNAAVGENNMAGDTNSIENRAKPEKNENMSPSLSPAPTEAPLADAARSERKNETPPGPIP